jgi:hypothetical protein
LAWRRFRFRRAVMWAAFLAGLAWLPIFGSLTGSWMLAAIPWWGSWIGAAIWFHRSRCPRCGERVTSRDALTNPFTSKCLHCGLRIGSVDGD